MGTKIFLVNTWLVGFLVDATTHVQKYTTNFASSSKNNMNTSLAAAIVVSLVVILALLTKSSYKQGQKQPPPIVQGAIHRPANGSDNDTTVQNMGER